MSFKKILITGASSGIGKALAIHYAQQGVCLFLSGRDQTRLEITRHACEQAGAKEIEIRRLDVRDQSAMEKWIDTIELRHDLDLVVANAGISGGTGGSESSEEREQIEEIFAVNWQGVLNTVMPALAHMQARGSGHIALMSSLAGFRGWPGAPAYCASKAAVKVLGEGLRGSVKKSGVQISVICPGFVKSTMTDQNNFLMPFMIDAMRAAKIIDRGLSRNKGRIAFPLPSLFFAWFFSVIPNVLADFALQKTPAKNKNMKN